MNRTRWAMFFFLVLSLLLSSHALPQQPIHDAFQIRTITAGVNVTTKDYSGVLTEARNFLKDASAMMEKEGFKVQGTRIITQPHAYYLSGLSLEESIRIIKDMKLITAGFMFNIGPGIVTDIYDLQAIERILKSEAETFLSIVIATKQGGIHYNAIKACAETIKRFSDIDPFRNFYFAGIANVPSEVPFFPGGYHNRTYNSFTVGTEGASLFMKVCAQIGRLEDVKKALLESYERELKHVEKVALR